MTLIVESKLFPEYLQLVVTGEHSLDALLDFVATAKQQADDAGRRRLLVDGRGLDGAIPEAQKFFVGKRIAEVLGPTIKAALVMKESDITRLGETTAVNRGARFYVADSETKALAWLLG